MLVDGGVVGFDERTEDRKSKNLDIDNEKNRTEQKQSHNKSRSQKKQNDKL